MEFIAREVKRSKKKKRLHAFPPDRPDLDRKGVIVLCYCKMAWKKSSVSESQNLFYKTFHFSFFWNQTVFTNKQIASCENATEYKISPWWDEIDLFFSCKFLLFYKPHDFICRYERFWQQFEVTSEVRISVQIATYFVLVRHVTA